MSDELTPIQILRRFKDDSLEAKMLLPDDRRLCVEHLLGEGYGPGEMAEILKVSTRTIQRDLSDIRASHAVKQDDKAVAEYFGGVMLQGQQGITRLLKTARNPHEDGRLKVDAELGAWRILKERTLLLQKAGILPTAAQEIQADINHRFENPSKEQLFAQYEHLRSVVHDVSLPEDLTLAVEGVGRDALALMPPPDPPSEEPCSPEGEMEDTDAR